ncbi:uncharacterized protein BDZ99DRAFT_176852 [Mytilinidion resinicola]|uniref:Uncharacterized protein n=1 Tax=Mytilinidion resinicola TaxID=574789 RepID=A0A6A6Y2Y7_9PEZI|nr:uncharacterized protein BDZ99DRAFT_176852 [Mytilinidion resinicola]KAF2802893.1 hypothetical protein BDZ99DRAFT_176852 [Mytilinidion resinicola]
MKNAIYKWSKSNILAGYRIGNAAPSPTPRKSHRLLRLRSNCHSVKRTQAPRPLIPVLFKSTMLIGSVSSMTPALAAGVAVTIAVTVPL